MSRLQLVLNCLKICSRMGSVETLWIVTRIHRLSHPQKSILSSALDFVSNISWPSLQRLQR